LLRKYFNKVLLSTNSSDKYFYLGLPMIEDIVMEEDRFKGRAMRDLRCGIDVYIY